MQADIYVMYISQVKLSERVRITLGNFAGAFPGGHIISEIKGPSCMVFCWMRNESGKQFSHTRLGVYCYLAQVCRVS